MYGRTSAFSVLGSHNCDATMNHEIVTTAECKSLFDYWRRCVMGNLNHTRRLEPSIAGYMYRPNSATGSLPEPIPLGLVRLGLRALVANTKLTTTERTTIDLYYGLHGLPLPLASKKGASAGRGKAAGTAGQNLNRGLRKIARRTGARFLKNPPAHRVLVDPLFAPWFPKHALGFTGCQRLVRTAFQGAISECDGPSAKPTRAALERWYENCVYFDLDLRSEAARRDYRHSSSTASRALALMEIAVWEEVHSAGDRSLQRLPVRSELDPTRVRLEELVTSTAIARLVHSEATPSEVVRASIELRQDARDGRAIMGQLAFVVRELRRQRHHLTGDEATEVGVALTDVAAVRSLPFLALEWYSYALHRCGVTDFTFTMLVNASVAATGNRRFRLASAILQTLQLLEPRWEVPRTWIDEVERQEVRQQILVAKSAYLRRRAQHRRRTGNTASARDNLVEAIRLGRVTTEIAFALLTDESRYAAREIEGKPGRHGGDLEWPWLIGAVLRITEPAAILQHMIAAGEVDRRDIPFDLDLEVRRMNGVLANYGGPLDTAQASTRLDLASREIDSVLDGSGLELVSVTAEAMRRSGNLTKG